MTTAEKYKETELAEMMHKAGIRPSAQRIAVFSVVANTRCHPSAEEVYTMLCERFPSLSRTTVYNSLHTLTEAGLLRELEIETGNMRYDLAPQPRHSHFICRKCGRIFDMGMPSLIEKEASEGFEVEDIDVYFKGLCPQCHGSSGTN